MESGDSMERDGVWMPLTPGKPIPTRLGLGLGFHSVPPMGGQHNCKAALNSGQGTGIENINEAFPFMGSLNATGYLERNGINDMYGLKAGVHEHEADLGVAEKDRKSNAADQHDKVPHSECNNKNAHGVHESQAGVDSVPNTPSEKKDSRKRRNDGINLNKKPSQRPRMKKHRPKILDDSKPKKVPKAQTPRVSTPRPKTPKPVTPNRVHERRKPAKKNTFTGSTSYSYTDVVQDVQSASKSSLIVFKSCKRSLDFNHHLVDRESRYVSKSYEEQPRTVNYDLGGCNYFGKIVKSKRNTPRRSRFQKKCLNDSDDLLGDNNNNKQQCHQEVAETNVRRFVYFYQRRKKRSLISIPTLQVYRRTYKANQCLQNSKKSGPNFPSIFKKRRAKRRKANINGNWWYIMAFEDGKNYVKRSLRKRIETTLKSVNNRVNKSKNRKEVVKPDLYTSERFLHVFLTKKRKRSIRHTRRRENIMEFPIFNEKRTENNIMELSLFNANTYESENCFSRKEENFLKITECLPLQEVPIQTIESFTSSHVDVQLVDNSVDSMKSLQLQEVPVVESQSLLPENPLSKKELNELYVREIVEFVRRKMENLDINGESKELVVRNGNFSGTLVKIDPPKKRKVLPKVNLDEETLRMWKFLMENDGSEPVEETDKEKEEWWERQRKVFRGRVDSFIAKMHLIQGNRRFSQWKGSVVDSVVGVYLTQNVSDHLSSSAFMSLAAKFPVKFTSKEVCNHGEVETHQELVNETEKDMITSCADVSDSIPTIKPEQEGVSNPFLIQDNPRVDGNSNTFRKLLDIEEVDFLKQFYSSGNDNGNLNASKEGEEEQTATSFDLSISHEPCATISDLNVGLCEISVFKNVEREKNENNEHLNYSDGEFLVQQTSTTLEEKEEPINVGLCEISVFKNVEREKNEGNKHLNHSDGEFIVQQKSTTLEEKEEPINVGLCEISVFKNVEREKNENNEHLNHSDGEFIVQQKSTTLEEEEPIIATPICTLNSEFTIEQRVDSVNDHLLDPRTTGKKKSRTDEKQETKTDWESLRRTYCKNERKETNENNMDAVDWDAVRRATVEEIAETIVERGMNNVLAARIKEFLERMVKDHGSIDLEWLRDVPPDKAKEFLLSIQGIGLKSVECVRLLTLHHLAFPVDTNVGRVATRLGWVPLQPLPEEVQIHLLNAYPMMDSIQKYLFPRLCTLDQRTLYELHYQLITFGKVFCTKKSPNCNACPMRAECRHYASAFASARLALPGPKESTSTSIIVPAEIEQNHSTLNTPPPPSFDLELNNLSSSYHNPQNNEPIIEVPSSPEPEDALLIIRDIEDYYCDLDDEIPTIRLNTEEFRETLKDTIEVSSISIPEDEMSKAIVALTAQAASIPAPRMKYVAKLRTVHYVYELPDYHPSLAGFDEREHDDPTPYLLAIWLTDETSNSLEYNNDQEETVKGTILIPCRTANRGKFPLNGTYFQVNEVFADDETSWNPMEVPRCQLWNLPRRYLGCGTSATSIFKALSTSDIQRCFWKGSICVRGFNIKTRQPRPLHRRFHISTTAIAAENKRSGKR